MARFIGCALVACTIACASAATRIVQIRSVSSSDDTDVAELEPGHFAGRWSNHAIDIWNPGHTDEETFVCTESGTFDGVWTGPGKVSRCELKSTKVCKHPDGTQTYAIVETCKPGPKGLLIFQGKASLVSATGRFEGMKVSACTFTSWQVVPGPHDYGYSHITLEVMLPKR